MNRPEALAIVREFVKNENLVHHMFAVESAMRFYADKFGKDVETWGLTGFSHFGEDYFLRTSYRRIKN